MVYWLRAFVTLAAGVLFFTATAHAQTLEAKARRDAAVADFRKVCAQQYDAYVRTYVPHPSVRSRDPGAEILALWTFIDARSLTNELHAAAALRPINEIRIFINNAETALSANPSPGNYLGLCARKLALHHALHGVPGYDHHSVGGGSTSAPAPSPQAARKPAPKAAAPAEKLPPARPAKMAPWSPKALPARQATLSPRLAAERADIMAACTASLLRAHPGQPRGEIALEYETQLLDDTTLGASSQELAKKVSRLDSWIASNAGSPELPSYRLGKCLIQRRIAQLEGAPLATGAVDGTLTPLSIAGQTPPSKQEGKDAKIIASDGKSAMDCVKLVELTKTDSSTSGGGRVLSNQCSGPVEIVWCISPGECQRGSGNAWTVAAGRSWPVSAQGEVRWAACHGANTAAHVKGSFGLRYYCSAPAKK